MSDTAPCAKVSKAGRWVLPILLARVCAWKHWTWLMAHSRSLRGLVSTTRQFGWTRIELVVQCMITLDYAMAPACTV